LDPNDDQDREPRAIASLWLNGSLEEPVGSRLPLAANTDYLSNWNNNFDQINDIGMGTMFTSKGWLADCYPSGNPANDGGACSKQGADTGYTTSAVLERASALLRHREDH